MASTCPHCLENIPWRSRLVATVPGRLIVCARCGSRLRLLDSGGSSRLMIVGLVTLFGYAAASPAFSAWPAIQLAIYFCMVISGAVALTGLFRLSRLRVTRASGRFCYRCGYDLTSNTSGTCPECGHFSPVPVDWSHVDGEPLPAELRPAESPPLTNVESDVSSKEVDLNWSNPPKDVA